MSLLKINHYAHNLGYQNELQVCLPDNLNSNQDIGVVLLLHGMWGNETDFGAYNIEKYAHRYKKVLVSVSAHNSYYMNCKTGENFFDYVSSEIFEFLEQYFLFTINEKSIIGISMGGYGSMYIGLSNDFNNIANLSGSVVIENRLKNTDDNRFFNITDNFKDLQKVDVLLKSKEIKGKVFSYCGSNDFLFEDNQKIMKLIEDNVQNNKCVIDKGAHDYESWNNIMPEVFNYFFGGEN